MSDRKSTISERLGDNFISRAYLARSLQKYKQGLRTTEKIIFKGQELRGQFLLSTYTGAEHCCITTPHWQWVGLTAELGEHQEFKIERNHKKIAKSVGVVVDPDGPPQFIEEGGAE